MKNQKIDFFFPKQCSTNSVSSSVPMPSQGVVNDVVGTLNNSEDQDCISGSSSTKNKEINQSSESSDELHIERDPGLRKPIWNYPIEKRDEIRRAYLRFGPYQCIPEKSPSYVDKHRRRFLPRWYTLFPDWLEFSPSKNAAYCLPCFLFVKPSTFFGSGIFIIDGFQAWKKVNGKDCAFLKHVGNCPNSSHKMAVKQSHDLMNSLQHIQRIIDKQTSESIAKSRLRLKVSIDVAKLCAFQGVAFRGRDERPESLNRGNFLEMIKHTTLYNDEVNSVVLGNAPHNATYTSGTIQKEILSVYATKIQRFIREEMGDSKYCIIVDESKDESKREQMAIVLRFVDKNGFIRERFFDIVHVEDTKSSTLKGEIFSVLSRNNLTIQNIRGQGYDGASTMRGEWNGLQALVLSECPYAYYVHCFAHRLQLVLVATAKSVIPIEHFFSYVSLIVNMVDSSSKRHDQLQIASAIQIAELTGTGELQTGKGKNQVGTVQRPGDTRWGSHLRSLRSLLKLFDSILIVLREIINDKSSLSTKASADGAYDMMTSFEFVFILHFMIELLAMTDDLCKILQYKTQDILNAMDAVVSTKRLLQKFRENGWDQLFDKVKSFCEKHKIEIPDMTSVRRSGRGRKRKGDPITLNHHYRFDIFTDTLDVIIQEMNYRFDESAVELLKLGSALDPRNGYESFNIDDICKLVEKFYPADFTDQEKSHIRYQLQVFQLDIQSNKLFEEVSNLPELCQFLSKTGKAKIYNLVDRLVRLILTLPVSTATSERAFSSMKIVKTRLRNKMEDGFLASSLLMYIEKEIAQTFDVDSIIEEFEAMKTRRAQLTMPKLSK